jgi:hypothetical protein
MLCRSQGVGGKGSLHLLVKNGIDFMPIILIGIRSLFLLRRRCKILLVLKRYSHLQVVTYFFGMKIINFGF